MKYGIYRTMTKDRKNHVILSHDDIKDMFDGINENCKIVFGS